jgi:hypothetical protein
MNGFIILNPKFYLFCLMHMFVEFKFEFGAYLYLSSKEKKIERKEERNRKGKPSPFCLSALAHPAPCLRPSPLGRAFPPTRGLVLGRSPSSSPPLARARSSAARPRPHLSFSLATATGRAEYSTRGRARRAPPAHLSSLPHHKPRRHVAPGPTCHPPLPPRRPLAMDGT